MNRVVAIYAALGAGCAYKLSRPGHQAYDIDTAHLRWEQIHERNARLNLPSAYNVASLDVLRYRFDGGTAGSVDDGTIRLDEHTQCWIEADGASQSFAQTVMLAALSTLMPRCDAQAKLDLPAVHLLSPEQWKTLLRHQKMHTALDVGAGAGHITRCFASLFDEVFAIEVSDGLVARLSQCGFTAANTTQASPTSLQNLGMPSSFDTVFALNILDRVPESDAFLTNLVALTAPGGLLVVALPLPYCPKPWSDADVRRDDGETWSQKNSLSLHIDPALSRTSWEHEASAIIERLKCSGLRVERLVRAPYLCQGGWGASGPLVLDGAVFVARKSEEDTS